MLEVREQVRLSFKRMLELCIDSISYRLLRSLVTVIIIVLAIAFLATIMVEGYLGRSLRDAVRGRARELTAYSNFLSRAAYVEPEGKLLATFAGLREGTADFRNLAGWTGGSEAQARAFVEVARLAKRYLDFFEDVPSGRRVLLVQLNRGPEIFDWLMKRENLELFERRLADMKSLRLPGSPGEFRGLLSQWPGFRQKLAVVRDNYGATVARIAEFAGEKGLGGKLVEAVERRETEAFFGQVAKLGFHVEADLWPHIVEGMEYGRRVEWAMQHLRQPAVRNGWNREFQEKFSPPQALISCARRTWRAKWIETTLLEEKEKAKKKGEAAAPDFDRQRFLEIARTFRMRARLLESEQSLLNRYGQTERLSEKTVWLIFVSFLVCVVGIVNAMLMSVLERFKEIATMKCLGARNQTIAFLFVTESTIMGVIGGMIGTVIGFLIVFVRQLVSHGALLFKGFPVGDMFTALGVCFACSLLLATIAAIYPARVAARMAPMEAMRVD